MSLHEGNKLMQDLSNNSAATSNPTAQFIRVAFSTFDQDQELHHRIRRFLTRCEPHNANNVKIDVQGGHVILRGRVNTSNQRRVCVGAVRRVPGVLQVIDELEFTS